MSTQTLTATNDAYPKNYWKLLVFTFCMGWTIIWVYRAMLSPIYPEIQATIGPQTNAAMGIIASCYFFGYTALQIPSGYLVDKFGQKKVLIPGFTLFAAGVFQHCLRQDDYADLYRRLAGRYRLWHLLWIGLLAYFSACTAGKERSANRHCQ